MITFLGRYIMANFIVDENGVVYPSLFYSKNECAPVKCEISLRTTSVVRSVVSSFLLGGLVQLFVRIPVFVKKNKSKNIMEIREFYRIAAIRTNRKVPFQG